MLSVVCMCGWWVIHLLCMTYVLSNIEIYGVSHSRGVEHSNCVSLNCVSFKVCIGDRVRESVVGGA